MFAFRVALIFGLLFICYKILAKKILLQFVKFFARKTCLDLVFFLEKFAAVW
jgi:hypothetical protein